MLGFGRRARWLRGVGLSKRVIDAFFINKQFNDTALHLLFLSVISTKKQADRAKFPKTAVGKRKDGPAQARFVFELQLARRRNSIDSTLVV